MGLRDASPPPPPPRAAREETEGDRKPEEAVFPAAATRTSNEEILVAVAAGCRSSPVPGEKSGKGGPSTLKFLAASPSSSTHQPNNGSIDTKGQKGDLGKSNKEPHGGEDGVVALGPPSLRRSQENDQIAQLQQHLQGQPGAHAVQSRPTDFSPSLPSNNQQSSSSPQTLHEQSPQQQQLEQDDLEQQRQQQQAGGGVVASSLSSSSSSSSQFLAQATPIDESSKRTKENLQRAEPVHASVAENTEDESEGSEGNKQSRGTGQPAFLSKGAVMIWVIMAVGLGLVLGLVFRRGRSNGSSELQEEANPPSQNQQDPTTQSSPSTASLNLLDDLPSYTLDALKDPESPQSLAYEWLLNNNRYDQQQTNNNNNTQTQIPQPLPKWKQLQRFSMATMFFSLGGSDWFPQPGWLINSNNGSVIVDSDECYWVHNLQDSRINVLEDHPEVCDSEGRITYVVLPNNNLIGTLPPEIALLSSSLRYIDYSFNRIRGRIPTQIGLLTQLTAIRTDFNDLTGSLPTQLGNLMNLHTVLSGANKKLGGPIPSELGLLSNNLIKITLQRNSHTGVVPTELYQLTNLESLHLFKNTDLQATGYLNTERLLNWNKLQRLGINHVQLKDVIPSEMGELTDLQDFNFRETHLRGSIPSNFWGLTSMRTFVVATNQLVGSFPHQLGRLKNVTKVCMEENSFTSTLPASAFNADMGKLTLLSLHENLISGSLPSQLGLLQKLDTLSLHNNPDLSGTLPSQLAMLVKKNLKILTLTNTSLYGRIPDELCDVVQHPLYQCTPVAAMEGNVTTCAEGDPAILFPKCEGTMLCGCGCQECEPQ